MNLSGKVAFALLLLIPVTPLFAVGEAVGTFPRWEERALHQLTNRARANPAAELAGCNASGSNCSAAELNPSCYTPIAPLAYNLDLNEAARFHSAHMGRSAYFAHESNCVLFNDIDARYPETCDGSAVCSCAGAGQTTSATRVSLFGATYTGEIIAAGQTDPFNVFYAWLYEPAPASACSFNPLNGHRFLILKNTGPGIGYGYDFLAASQFDHYWTGDFGSPGVLTKIPSGSHWGAVNRLKQDSSVEFWANWFDGAGPIEANVVVDGIPRPLTLARGTATNGAWTATVSGMGSGCHRYYFSFRDSGGVAQRYPTTGSLGVGDNTCADWSISSGASARFDFNGDGRSDVFWRHDTGLNAIWFMNTFTASGAFTTSLDSSWIVAGMGDFNGDGRSDVLWRHPASGTNAIWLMNGTTPTGAYTETLDSSWTVAGVGDFDGDGKADIFWRHLASATNAIWFMNGSTRLSGAYAPSLDSTWSLRGVGDFNGDGRSDILWRHAPDINAIWLMNGATPAGAYTNSLDSTWTAVSTGDFNADGRADIFWRHNTGLNGIWLMTGAAVTGGAMTTSLSSDWSVVASGDYNGDLMTDIMWRQAGSGQTAVWLMNSTTETGGFTPVLDTTWQAKPNPATSAQ